MEEEFVFIRLTVLFFCVTLRQILWGFNMIIEKDTLSGFQFLGNTKASKPSFKPFLLILVLVPIFVIPLLFVFARLDAVSAGGGFEDVFIVPFIAGSLVWFVRFYSALTLNDFRITANLEQVAVTMRRPRSRRGVIKPLLFFGAVPLMMIIPLFAAHIFMDVEGYALHVLAHIGVFLLPPLTMQNLATIYEILTKTTKNSKFISINGQYFWKD